MIATEPSLLHRLEAVVKHCVDYAICVGLKPKVRRSWFVFGVFQPANYDAAKLEGYMDAILEVRDLHKLMSGAMFPLLLQDACRRVAAKTM